MAHSWKDRDMKAIFFGSIGSVVETSEMQRKAFNQAFEEQGMDCHWDRSTYQQLLRESGGRRRKVNYSSDCGEAVDAIALHAKKTELFQEMLWNGGFEFRPGVLDVLALAEARSLRRGVITGTEKETADLIATSLASKIGAKLDIATSREDGHHEKPSPALYLHAMATLDVEPQAVIAIEDNPPGCRSGQ